MLLDPQGPVVQGFILATGIIGNLYVSHMNLKGFYWWLASNVALVAVSVYAQLWGMVALYMYFGTMSVYSIFRWKQIRSTEQTEQSA